MIACFPDPYPDEVLYSICARYSDRVNYPRKVDVIKELFGENCRTARIDLVRHLDYLLSMLLVENQYTATDFINNHTFLPYYRPFISKKRAASIIESMLKVGVRSSIRTEGAMQPEVPKPEWVRFCPVCVDEDRRNFGEAYWHRLHQLPGIFVCPTHSVFLENSRLRFVPRINNPEFISAEKAREPKQVQQLKSHNSVHNFFLKLAKDALWLLTYHNYKHDLIDLNDQYMILARKHGFETQNGQFDKRCFSREFFEEYPNDVLELLGSQGTFIYPNPWLNYFIASPKILQHPLRHLLVIHFFQHTAETFFKNINRRLISQDTGYFGKGPWPCFNPKCNFFMEKVIEYFDYTHDEKLEKYIATFACPDCNSMYSHEILKSNFVPSTQNEN